MDVAKTDYGEDSGGVDRVIMNDVVVYHGKGRNFILLKYLGLNSHLG